MNIYRGRFFLTLLASALACGAHGAPPPDEKEDIKRLLKEVDELDQEAVKRFEKWEKQAVADLAADRREAARRLSEFPTKAVPALVKLLEDKDADVRLAAVEAIHKVITGTALVGTSGGRTPSWTGKYFEYIFDDQLDALSARLLKLQAEDGKIKSAAEQTARRLTVCIAASRVVLKSGNGIPILKHPKGLVSVQRGELLDDSGKRLAILNRSGNVACWTFSPDGQFLAVGIRSDSTQKGRDGTIRGYLHLYDATKGDKLADAGHSQFGPVEHLAFSKDGKTILYEAGKYQEIGGK